MLSQLLGLVNKSFTRNYQIYFNRNDKSVRHKNTKLSNSEIFARLSISFRAEEAQIEDQTAMAPPQNPDDPVVVIMPLVIMMAGKTMVVTMIGTVTVALTVMMFASFMLWCS